MSRISNAIKEGNLDSVESELRSGELELLNQPDSDENNQTPLQCAISQGQLEIVRFLLMQPNIKISQADVEYAKSLYEKSELWQKKSLVNIIFCLELVEAILNSPGGFSNLVKRYDHFSHDYLKFCLQTNTAEVTADIRSRLLPVELAIKHQRLEIFLFLIAIPEQAALENTNKQTPFDYLDALIASNSHFNNFPSMMNDAKHLFTFFVYQIKNPKKYSVIDFDDPNVDLKQVDDEANTLLHIAIQEKNVSAIKDLLSNQQLASFIFLKNSNNQDAFSLFQAVWKESSSKDQAILAESFYLIQIKILRLKSLEAFKADFSKDSGLLHERFPPYESTGLHLAVEANRPDLVKFILAQKDTQCWPRDARGMVPVTLAREKNLPELVTILEKAQEKQLKKVKPHELANLVSLAKSPTSKPYSPISLEEHEKYFWQSALYAIQMDNIVYLDRALQKYPGFLNYEENTQTLLKEAIAYQRPQLVLYLLEKKELHIPAKEDLEAIQLVLPYRKASHSLFQANQVKKDRKTMTQIQSLVFNRNLTDLKIALSQKPDLINKLDEKGASLLHYAVAIGNDEMVAFLVKNKDIRLVQDKRGKTPLDLAKIYSNPYKHSSILLRLTAFDKIRDRQAEEMSQQIELTLAQIIQDLKRRLSFNLQRKQEKKIFLEKILEVYKEFNYQKTLSDIVYEAVNLLKKDEAFTLPGSSIMFACENKRPLQFKHIMETGFPFYRTQHILSDIMNSSAERAVDKIKGYIAQLDADILKKQRKIALLNKIIEAFCVPHHKESFSEIFSKVQAGLKKSAVFEVHGIDFSFAGQAFSMNDLPERNFLARIFNPINHKKSKEIVEQLEASHLKEDKKEFLNNWVETFKKQEDQSIVGLAKAAQLKLHGEPEARRSVVLQGHFSKTYQLVNEVIEAANKVINR